MMTGSELLKEWQKVRGTVLQDVDGAVNCLYCYTLNGHCATCPVAKLDAYFEQMTGGTAGATTTVEESRALKEAAEDEAAAEWWNSRAERDAAD